MEIKKLVSVHFCRVLHACRMFALRAGICAHAVLACRKLAF